MFAREGPTRCFRLGSPISLLTLRPTLFGPVLLGQASAVRVRRGEAVRLRDLPSALHQVGYHAGAPETSGPPLGALLQEPDVRVVAVGLALRGGYAPEGTRERGSLAAPGTVAGAAAAAAATTTTAALAAASRFIVVFLLSALVSASFLSLSSTLRLQEDEVTRRRNAKRVCLPFARSGLMLFALSHQVTNSRYTNVSSHVFLFSRFFAVSPSDRSSLTAFHGCRCDVCSLGGDCRGRGLRRSFRVGFGILLEIFNKFAFDFCFKFAALAE